MRPALVTIVPMLAAAVLVMVGGERMARRDVEVRTPADRGRLLDLADSFRSEMVRLDTLYMGHLDELTRRALYLDDRKVGTEASSLTGVELIRIFPANGKDRMISPSLTQGRLPEVELEGRKRPLDRSTAVVLDAGLLDGEASARGFWRATSDPDLRLYCRRPEPGFLTAVLVNLADLRERTTTHLTDWLQTPLTPLREAGERVTIEPPQGPAIASIGSATHGPSALILPTRTISGDWQIRAWDGLAVTRSHDAATLAVATVFAVALVVSGMLLFFQQKRALKQAAERVSFVNRVSHDLGTPLTSLSLNLDLACEAMDTRPAEARRRLGLVGEEIERLARLVANVLTFSRRERDTLELKPVRCVPGEIVERTLDSFRSALERRGIKIDSQIRAREPGLLDADALSQITGNLLSNVEKYAAAGGWVGIESELRAGALILEVSDHGPGIPEAARQRIFEPFERVVDSTNEGSSGTGLGLAISGDLARRMGGTLELLTSEQGAVFRLSVPVRPSLALSSQTDAA